MTMAPMAGVASALMSRRRGPQQQNQQGGQGNGPQGGPISTPGTPMDMSTQGRLNQVSAFTTGNDDNSYATMAALVGGQGRSGDAIQNAQQRLQVDTGAYVQSALVHQREQQAADQAEKDEMTAATREFQAFDPFSDEVLNELNRLDFANTANAAAWEYMNQRGGIKRMMAGAGLKNSGVGAGLAAHSFNQRFQSIVEGQRKSMASNKTNQLTMKAAHAGATHEARTRLAQVFGKDVPILDTEMYKNMIDKDMAELGAYIGYKANSEAAAAAERAGQMAMIGNIAQGVLGGIL